MVIKTASPGILVNEVDLTRGTSDAIITNLGALAGPFKRGPVDQIVRIETEAELQRVIGDPTDENFEYWWTVSNFLEYGGICYVVRCDDSIGDSSGEFLQTMRNAADLDDGQGEYPYVKNEDDFINEKFQSDSVRAKFLAQTPGAWGNGLAVAVIDRGADLRVNLNGLNAIDPETGAVSPKNELFDDTTVSGSIIGTYVKLVTTSAADRFGSGTAIFEVDGSGNPIGGKGVVVESQNGAHKVLVTEGGFSDGSQLNTGATISDVYAVGTQRLYKVGYGSATLGAEVGFQLGVNDADATTADTLTAEFRFDGTANNPNIIDTIWVPDVISFDTGLTYGWPNEPRDGQKVIQGGPATQGDVYQYRSLENGWVNLYQPGPGTLVYDGTWVFPIEAADDWYSQQIAFAGIPWYRFASRPGTTKNAREKGTLNDEMHIIVYDATGEFTGTRGNTLEIYTNVSKCSGALAPEGERNYYLDQINRRSNVIFANHTLGMAPDGLNEGLDPVGTPIGSGVRMGFIVPGNRVLSGGVDNLYASLGELQAAYNKFEVENLEDLDYILQGPAGGNLEDSVAKANFLISICEERKDCMTFISPPRYMIVNQTDNDRITDDLVVWADQLSSSSYAVFDSGYKYTYDRFNDEYRFVPLNGDVAGCMVYTALRAEPFYSPAGLARGQIRNVVKLPYNPGKKHRDLLYSNRINPVATFPGEGTLLYGDKTALGYSSAFDRINVRKLFLICEKEIAKISRTTLFEFNDEVTRTLFKNNVNPFLRDIQSKRGMYDFLVVCDQTNNTPEVIDRNEFIADIYIKPAKSINFITLNFIATKTGVSFDESIGLFRRNST